MLHLKQVAQKSVAKKKGPFEKSRKGNVVSQYFWKNERKNKQLINGLNGFAIVSNRGNGVMWNQ